MARKRSKYRQELKDPISVERDYQRFKEHGQKIAYDLSSQRSDSSRPLDDYQDVFEASFKASKALLAGMRSPKKPHRYDVFLSHSKKDEARVKKIRREFEGKGYKVFVDWLDAPSLDRTQVGRDTASDLQEEMRQCKALILALSARSAGSSWVQWELGFFDALRGKIFILPLSKRALQTVKKQEYHQLYRVLDPADYVTDFVRQYGESVA